MSIWTDLYRGETRFDFIGQRKRWFIVSAVLMTVSILSLLFFQLDLSVDFTGGTIVEASNETGATVAEVRDELSGVGQETARVQVTEGGAILVQTKALDSADQDELVATVAAVAGVSVDDTNVDAVGPTFGDEITRRAIRALLIFLVVVVIWISWRLRSWKMALAALAALFHDLILTAGVYSLVGFLVTPSTVIAVLTILGYSLYDTVVVFDKIRENVHDLGNRYSFSEIANLSLNQVLMRSINTSLTTLLPIGALLFVGSYLLGAATLREFALAMFIGVAAGTYSSIFVATPLLTVWTEREPEWQRARRRAARRVEGEAVVVTVGGESGPSPEAAEMAPEVAIESRETGAVPRPPRHRKKRR